MDKACFVSHFLLIAYLDRFQFFTVTNNAAISILAPDLTGHRCFLGGRPWGVGIILLYSMCTLNFTWKLVLPVFSKVTLAIYIPNSSTEEYDFLHIHSNAWHCQNFLLLLVPWEKMVYLCGFHLPVEVPFWLEEALAAGGTMSELRSVDIDSYPALLSAWIRAWASAFSSLVGRGGL